MSSTREMKVLGTSGLDIAAEPFSGDSGMRPAMNGSRPGNIPQFEWIQVLVKVDVICALHLLPECHEEKA